MRRVGGGLGGARAGVGERIVLLRKPLSYRVSKKKKIKWIQVAYQICFLLQKWIEMFSVYRLVAKQSFTSRDIAWTRACVHTYIWKPEHGQSTDQIVSTASHTETNLRIQMIQLSSVYITNHFPIDESVYVHMWSCVNNRHTQTHAHTYRGREGDHHFQCIKQKIKRTTAKWAQHQQ